MSAETASDPKFEIGHILFIDVVGYSKLLINEQSDLLRELNEVVRGVKQFRSAEAESRLVRLPTGDGMALVFRDSPESPVQCALEISEALRDHSHIKVRMGVHSGPVNEVADVNERENIAGAGINMAQRVMDCGDAGHILLSKHVAEDLEAYARWQPYLHDLGECEIKHNLRISVVNFCSEKVGNPLLPAKLEQVRKNEAGRRKWTVIKALLILTVALAAGLAIFRDRTTQSLPGAAAVAEKSIAVLPFENLSDDKQNAFFVDGVQDEILTHLARIADLKVISRTSVMQYKSNLARNLREIGRTLGVSHVLEGSVQRVANRVRVNAQLINAQTDAHVWGDTYDRDLADVFAIQSEIAKTIATQLRTKLSPAEKAGIDQKPTSDLAAFELYTRGKALIEIALNSDNPKEVFLQGIDFLNRAVDRDPVFLDAWCQLARGNDLLYIVGFDHTPSRFALGQAAADNALRLAPDAAETHLALAMHLYGSLEYDRAAEELAVARGTLPNSARVFELSGYINRRKGRWAESARDFEQALEFDPSNVLTLQQLAQTYQAVRAYRDEARTWDRILALRSDDFDVRISRAQVDVFWRADTRPLHAVLEAGLTNDPAAAKTLAQTRIFLALFERDFAGLEDSLAALGSSTFGQSAVRFSQAFGKGLLARMKGDAAAAQAAFAVDRLAQERMLQAQPDYALAISVLGIVDAGLGRKEDALREGRRAIELLPVSKDSLNGPLMVMNLAIIAAWIGEKDLALEHLRVASQLPAGPTYGDIKMHPFWDPLRDDQRFEKIVTSLAPKD